MAVSNDIHHLRSAEHPLTPHGRGNPTPLSYCGLSLQWFSGRMLSGSLERHSIYSSGREVSTDFRRHVYVYSELYMFVI